MKAKFINGPLIGEYKEVAELSPEVRYVDSQDRIYHYRRLDASELYSFEYEVKHLTVHEKG